MYASDYYSPERVTEALRAKHVDFVDWRWLGSAVRLPEFDWHTIIWL